MSLRAGSRIGAYRLTGDFRAGANGRYAIAERDGARFFVKEFPRPKYPPELVSGAVRQSKLRRCAAFEQRQRRLVQALGTVCAPGGNIVMPVDFFRLNLSYYHIAPCIDTTSLAPADIAGLDMRERLFVLRLLSRSLVTLHSQAIVHGDLKPPNILIARGAGGMLAPKLIDFDGAYFAGEPPEDPDALSFDQTYMAPELLTFSRAGPGAGVAERQALGCAADIFSFAVLLHEYWTGRRPDLPDGLDCLAATVMSGLRPRLDPAGMPGGMAAAIAAALALNPRARPSACDLDAAIAAAAARCAGAADDEPIPQRRAARRPDKSRSGVTIRFSASLKRGERP